MLVGVMKAVPLAAVIGSLSLQNLALYVTVVPLIGGILVVGALVGAARAWRERAEARTDEAKQLEHEARERDKQIAALEGKVEELSRRPDLRTLKAEMSREHVELAELVRDGHRELTEGLGTITKVLEVIGRSIPWEHITAAGKPE